MSNGWIHVLGLPRGLTKIGHTTREFSVRFPELSRKYGGAVLLYRTPFPWAYESDTYVSQILVHFCVQGREIYNVDLAMAKRAINAAKKRAWRNNNFLQLRPVKPWI